MIFLEFGANRVQADPVVAEGVVRAQIRAVMPSRTDDRLAFLTAKAEG